MYALCIFQNVFFYSWKDKIVKLDFANLNDICTFTISLDILVRIWIVQMVCNYNFYVISHGCFERKIPCWLLYVFFCILEQPWCKIEIAFLTQMLFLSVPALDLLMLLFHSVLTYFTNVLSIGMAKTKYYVMTKR